MCSNIDENFLFQYKRKITEQWRGIPAETFIAQQPKAIES